MTRRTSQSIRDAPLNPSCHCSASPANASCIRGRESLTVTWQPPVDFRTSGITRLPLADDAARCTKQLGSNHQTHLVLDLERGVALAASVAGGRAQREMRDVPRNLRLEYSQMLLRSTFTISNNQRMIALVIAISRAIKPPLVGKSAHDRIIENEPHRQILGIGRGLREEPTRLSDGCNRLHLESLLSDQ